MLQKWNSRSNPTFEHQHQQSHCFTGIEGIKEARKIQRALVYYVICHMNFTLPKKAVFMKLKRSNPSPNMRNPVCVQYNRSRSALKSSGTAQRTAWDRSQAAEGGSFWCTAGMAVYITKLKPEQGKQRAALLSSQFTACLNFFLLQTSTTISVKNAYIRKIKIYDFLCLLIKDFMPLFLKKKKKKLIYFQQINP